MIIDSNTIPVGLLSRDPIENLESYKDLESHAPSSMELCGAAKNVDEDPAHPAPPAPPLELGQLGEMLAG